MTRKKVQKCALKGGVRVRQALRIQLGREPTADDLVCILIERSLTSILAMQSVQKIMHLQLYIKKFLTNKTIKKHNIIL